MGAAQQNRSTLASNGPLRQETSSNELLGVRSKNKNVDCGVAAKQLTCSFPSQGYKRSWPIHSKAFVDLERDYHRVPRGVLWPSAGLWYIDVGTSHPGLILLDKNKNC